MIWFVLAYVMMGSLLLSRSIDLVGGLPPAVVERGLPGMILFWVVGLAITPIVFVYIKVRR